jgi:hypothetical protein
VLIGDAPPNPSDPVKVGDVERRALEVDPADIYPIAVANGGTIDPATLQAFGEIAGRCRGEVLTTESAEELPDRIAEAVGRALGGSPGGGNMGDLVVCTDVVDGRPVGAAESFGPLAKVYGFMEYRGQPAGTELTVLWSSETGDTGTSRVEVEGTGSAWFWWSTTRAGGFEPGRYTLTISRGAEALARREFTIHP